LWQCGGGTLWVPTSRILSPGTARFLTTRGHWTSAVQLLATSPQAASTREQRFATWSWLQTASDAALTAARVAFSPEAFASARDRSECKHGACGRARAGGCSNTRDTAPWLTERAWDLVEARFDALIAMVRVAADPDYLRRCSADGLAILMAVMDDKFVWMLAAMAAPGLSHAS
jgi:hypothetical protein